MSDYVSDCPVSGPSRLDWKRSWDLGGMAWSHEWGMFYDVSSPDDTSVPMRPPNPVGEG